MAYMGPRCSVVAMARVSGVVECCLLSRHRHMRYEIDTSNEPRVSLDMSELADTTEQGAHNEHQLHKRTGR